MFPRPSKRISTLRWARPGAPWTTPNGWGALGAARRRGAMERLASALDKRAGEMVRRISSQNGMPVAVANQLEAVFPALLLRYYAAWSTTTPSRRFAPAYSAAPHWSAASRSAWSRRSYRGTSRNVRRSFKSHRHWPPDCTVVFKPSSETVLDTYLLAEAIAEAAAYPPGVVNIVPGGRDTGAYLV